MQRALLVGVGNALMGDDGIGPRVVEHIVQHYHDLRIEALCIASCGIELLAHFNVRWSRMLLVDCAMMQAAPGEMALLRLDDLAQATGDAGFSTHHSSLPQLFKMAKGLQLDLPETRILAIQPESIAMHDGLSLPLRTAFDNYVRTAINWLCPTSSPSSRTPFKIVVEESCPAKRPLALSHA